MNGESRGVGYVDYPTCAMAAFPSQMVAIGRARKRHSLLDQPIDGSAAILNHETSGCRVVQMTTGLKSIPDMGLDRVLAVKDCSNSALCPRRSADVNRAFADDGDTTMFGQPKCRRLAGKTATYDEDVKAMGHDKKWAAGEGELYHDRILH